MNNPFMFTPNFNPFSDNPAFLKKIFSTRLLMISIILVGAILLSFVYGTAAIFDYSSSFSVLMSQQEQLSYNIVAVFDGIFQIFCILFTFIAFIGMVALYINSVSPPEKSPGIRPSAFLCFRLFLMPAIVINIFGCIGAFLYSFMTDSSGTDVSFDLLYFVLCSLPAITGSFWTISAFSFCSSMHKTAKCTQLSAKGGNVFSVACMIHAFSMLTVMIIYLVTGFSNGMFRSNDYSVSVKGNIIKSSVTAVIMFFVFFISFIALMVCLSLIAKRFTNTVNNAARSLYMYGTNMYMNSDGMQAAYYNQPYMPPMPYQPPVPYQPPRPVQPAPENTVAPEGFIRPEPDMPVLSTSPDAPVSAATAGDNSDAIKNGTYVCPVCRTVNLAENKICYSCGNNRDNT